ncbi:alpha/beta hydrolase [Rugosimonospora africana]|uniref:Alpha/beta hydrolase n=1 Tax=Rugosimonospora africana TaxID=556532 RepID=A0A8J3VUV7_9ACTN|nr:alpha/beta hydrolase [Rugosimonospora africana]GIH19269.1 alpha/beta hydrolase [Rugosimonospora africana]
MSRQQRDALDAMLRGAPYNPGETVDEQRAGFAARQTLPVPADVAVVDRTLGDRPALEIRVTGAASTGTLLFLHGGGYVLGSPRTHAGLTAELARRTGTTAVSLDYRLAPEHPFPAAVEDALAAYRALLDSGVRAENLVLAGDSAGGGLVIATLLSAREAGLPQPAGAAVFSPWVDLTLSGTSMRTKQGADPIFTVDRLSAYADQYLGDRDRSASPASPLFADLGGLPPLLVQVGSHELLLDDAVRLAACAGAGDVNVTLEVWAGVPHVFQTHFATLEEAVAALDRAGQFLSDHLGAAEP